MHTEAQHARAHTNSWANVTVLDVYLLRELATGARFLRRVSNPQAWEGYAGDMLNFSDASVLPANVSKSNYR